MKKAGSLISGKRWSFSHGPDLDPLTDTVFLCLPGPVQTCRLLSAPLRCSLLTDKAGIHGIFALALSLSPFASPLLGSDMKCRYALAVKAQKKPNT